MHMLLCIVHVPSQVIEGKKSALRAAPEATPDELNEYFVGVGPRVAGEVRDRGEPPQLPCRLSRVGACAFTLEPVSLDFLRTNFLFSMKNSGACGSRFVGRGRRAQN